MIKKIIGVVVAVAVIVVIVVTVLHRNKYVSLVFDQTEPEAVYEAQMGESDILLQEADTVRGVDALRRDLPQAGGVSPSVPEAMSGANSASETLPAGGAH